MHVAAAVAAVAGDAVFVDGVGVDVGGVVDVDVVVVVGVRCSQ